MKIVVLAILTIFLFSNIGCTSKEDISQSNQPNIILFFVDDMGWQDTSVPFWNQVTDFNKLYRTPNMERLASEGMKFTQAYSTPVCSPTRVSLLSGMNAARHRVTNWTLYKNKLQPMETEHPDLIFPYWNVNGLSPDPELENAVYAKPFPSILKKAGYHTIHAGKAHFGAIGTPGENPLNLGFDINIGGHAAGAPKSYYGKENFGNTIEFENSPWPVPGLEKYHGQEINLTEALTIEAITAMDNSINQDNPFFLYMSHYTVHTPLMEDKKYYQRYLATGMDTIEARYASMVEGMDQSLGDLMDFIKLKGVEDETVILFMSDNGGLSAVARGGTKHTHNYPLSSGKGSIHEGGIREPMIVKWPGIVRPKSVNDNYLIIEDFFPTILEIAGIKDYDTPQQIDGISFVPDLTSLENESSKKGDQDRPLFWHYPNEWGPSGPGIGAFSAVRKGDMKLIYYHLNSNFELFNLSNDLKETHNLDQEKPEILHSMANLLTNYLKDVEAQMPSNKKTGLPIPFPAEVLHQ